nr:MAG: hypothetical protein [Sesarmops intermedium nimavirus]
MEIDHGSTDRQVGLSFKEWNDKENVITNLKDSIEILEENISYLKQQLEDGVVKYKEWDVKGEEKSLSSLQKTLDLVLKIQPPVYLEMNNFRDRVRGSFYDVVWVTEKWEYVLFRHYELFRDSYYTTFVEDNILLPCVTIQRWWKNILYQPDYFFKTSMFSKAKRNFDTLLKTRTMDIAKAPAEENRVIDQKPSPEPPSALQRGAKALLSSEQYSYQDQQIVISAEKTPVCDTAQDGRLSICHTRGIKSTMPSPLKRRR